MILNHSMILQVFILKDPGCWLDRDLNLWRPLAQQTGAHPSGLTGRRLEMRIRNRPFAPIRGMWHGLCEIESYMILPSKND